MRERPDSESYTSIRYATPQGQSVLWRSQEKCTERLEALGSTLLDVRLLYFSR
jgi:hypothetical protein